MTKTTATATNTRTREEYLLDAVEVLRPVFEEAGLEIPTQVRVSCGFPKGNVKKVIGQCWSNSCSADGVPQVFISPVISDSIEAIAVLIHELIHAIDNCEHGHKAPFVRMMKALGLEGKPTATVAGDDLKATIKGLIDHAGLGSYPHTVFTFGDKIKKQTTRMLKVECPEDGYTLRTTLKWLQVGLPVCPCGTEMVCDALGEIEFDPQDD